MDDISQPSTTIQLRPVGRIISPVSNERDMPLQGVEAEALILPEYAEALGGIDRHSHVHLLVWLHHASRDRLKTVSGRVKVDRPARGVFSLRSPVRPNPIGLVTTRLLAREGSLLRLENVDVVDGTPILDIKPYSTGWDCVFSARNNSTYFTYSNLSKQEALADMLRQAANFHGDRCVGVCIGVRAAYVAAMNFQCDLQDKDLTIVANTRGCIADALQSLCSAGNKRFSHPGGDGEIIFERLGAKLRLVVTDKKFSSVNEVMTAEDEEVFSAIEFREG